MVTTLTNHDTKWVSPSPLWDEYSDTRDSVIRQTFRRPAILRFDNDNFMDELLSVMAYQPQSLNQWQAQPETWREPMAQPPTLATLNTLEPISSFKQKQLGQLKSVNGSSQQSVSAEPVGGAVALAPDKPLKLYQPAHQRFYLVTASLVCRRIGLPDRFVDIAKQQKVEFVVRRLLPKSSTESPTPKVCNIDDCDEYAFIGSDSGFQWKRVSGTGISTSSSVLYDKEERLPMFNLGYEDQDKKRRPLAGFIPVGKREAYINAGLVEEPDEASDQATAQTSVSDVKRAAITQVFSMQVAGPWKSILTTAYNESQSEDQWDNSAISGPALADEFGGTAPAQANADNIKLTREKIQTVSWYILVDLANFLRDYIPNVYSTIKNLSAPTSITVQEQSLYDALASVSWAAAPPGGDPFYAELDDPSAYLEANLVSALKTIIDNPQIETDLDLLDHNYDRASKNDDAVHGWPSFLFPLADPAHASPAPQPLLNVEDGSDGEPDISHDQVDAITQLVREAIPLTSMSSAPDVTPASLTKADRRDGWFVIRCVYETPNCGPFQSPIVSEATVPFKMASFFDPDAPGRPITIPMPLDISPAGLRKFNKNASFMISDMLCGKLKGMRKNTLGDLVLSVLPWPFHKDLPDPGEAVCSKGGTGFGMICSFSIPIVTICAMILMIIMVTLFDIFFRWLPYLFLCLPVPGLKGKNNA